MRRAAIIATVHDLWHSSGHHFHMQKILMTCKLQANRVLQEWFSVADVAAVKAAFPGTWQQDWIYAEELVGGYVPVQPAAFTPAAPGLSWAQTCLAEQLA